MGKTPPPGNTGGDFFKGPAITPPVIPCILNGSACSHGARDARDRIVALFEQYGAQAEIILPDNADHLKHEAEKAAAENRIVVAGGGDGTLNAVASALIGKNAALGVLPLGTLNHFAKDLNIPLDLEGAITAILAGHTQRVDAGEVNGQIFLNNSSLGLYPAIVRQRHKQQHQGHGKWVSFAIACLYALRRTPPLEVSLQDGARREQLNWSPFLLVGNNRYAATGLHIGERARLDEGKLYLYRARGAHRTSVVSLAFAALFNRLDRRDLEISSAREFRVLSKKKQMHVAFDGEVTRMATPLHYRVIPAALDVIVPKE